MEILVAIAAINNNAVNNRVPYVIAVIDINTTNNTVSFKTEVDIHVPK